MSSVLDRSELEQSPLADLHLLANELGVDGFRRLRKAELIDAIVARQAGSPEPDADAEPEAAAGPESESEPELAEAIEAADAAEATEAADEEPDAAPRPARRSRRGGRSRRSRDAEPEAESAPREREREREPVAEAPGARDAEDRRLDGTVELLANGSAFVRVSPPEPTDEDAYVSAAQVKRCELVSGDRIEGPVRSPRRSERHPSMVRIDTINGRPADEVAEGTRFEDLPVAFPSERLPLGDEDPTVTAVEWLTPFGKGSRVSFVGPARAGKSETLRRVAAALSKLGGVEVSLVLTGVRPEEVAEWQDGEPAPLASLTFAASADAQAQAVEQAIEQGRRVAARGGDAVVVIDTLELLAPAAARRALAAARNLAGSGSLTVLATAPAPVGGETTVVALDAGLTALRRFPALDLAASGTMRPELLVGDAGADAIAKARAEALEV